MSQTADTYYKRDFWSCENLKYVQPHFRMGKAARIIRWIAGKNACDLLDVGCGPATLKQLLPTNIRYHGIDIAIHTPAEDLIQTDFLETPIKFGHKKFDLIIAQGVFEYVGNFQSQKFSEIAQILKENGTFVVSYVNFDHRNKNIYWPYNNTQSFDDFRQSLANFFRIDRIIPTSHRWYHDEPKGKLMKAIQMHVNWNIPFITRWFAVEYFFICSLRPSRNLATENARREKSCPTRSKATLGQR
jgi:SAM-dependent methyltransferase